MKCPFCMKICTKCKKLLVANEMNFSRLKGGKYGVKSFCKTCSIKVTTESYERKKKIEKEGNPFDNIDTNKVWNHCPFCIKVCTKCGEILVANSMNFRKNKSKKYGIGTECKICSRQREKEWRKYNPEYMVEYREEHKEELKEKRKEYYEKNKEFENERRKRYREEHKEELKEYGKRYYEDNKTYFQNHYKKYSKENPHIYINNANKRRVLLENQGSGITKEQWKEMMNFFEWRCAYSDEVLNKENRSIDHIIPLIKGGEHEIWNLVPMEKSHNCSKHANDMIIWYKQQEFFDIDRLMKIYEWQEYAFEKWGLNNGKEI